MDYWIVEGMAPIPVVTFENSVTTRTRAKKPLISVETIGDIKVLHGKTYDYKDYIKETLKGRWDAVTRKWTIPASADHQPLLDLVEDIQSGCTPHLSYGKCCRKAVYKDEYYMGPSYFECPTHGKRPCTSRGFGYTGD